MHQNTLKTVFKSSGPRRENYLKTVFSIQKRSPQNHKITERFSLETKRTMLIRMLAFTFSAWLPHDQTTTITAHTHKPSAFPPNLPLPTHNNCYRDSNHQKQCQPGTMDQKLYTWNLESFPCRQKIIDIAVLVLIPLIIISIQYDPGLLKECLIVFWRTL